MVLDDTVRLKSYERHATGVYSGYGLGMDKMRKVILGCCMALFMSVVGVGASGFINSEAYAQSVRLQTQSSEIYAGMPFQLSVVVSDFDETPQPEILPFTIDGADVQFIGVSPQISSMTSIINGRQSFKKEVTYIFNYQITPKREGSYTLPVIIARQGAREADSRQRVSFTAQGVQTTQDMKIELQIPNRKFWVGETFEAKIAWYLRKEVSSQVFSLPILQMPDAFSVEEPDGAPRGQALALNVGSRQLAFPYTSDIVTVNGLEYTRFLISVRLTPLKSGAIVIGPSQVLAELETDSRGHDIWGFARKNYKLYQAQDSERVVNVRELPHASRPATYSNAMGTDYAIHVTADRTILKVGDPIVLTIDISSPSALEGLTLPSLVSSGLNDRLFGVSNEDPIGENIDGPQNRNIKRFTVPVRVKSDRVTEIPALAFSYFNPATEKFTTVRSQPIALSVTAVDKIGAADVFMGKKKTEAVQSQPDSKKREENPGLPKDISQDMASGALDLGLVMPKSGTFLDGINRRPVRVGIYALPFVCWLGLGCVRRARKRRLAYAQQRRACETLCRAIEQAKSAPAKESAAPLNNALAQFLLATQSEKMPFNALSERIDLEAYGPEGQTKPLDRALLDELQKTVRTKTNARYAHIVASIFSLAFAIFLILVPVLSVAQDGGSEITYEAAAQTYHKAMSEQDHGARIAGYQRAGAMFETLGKRTPGDSAAWINAGNAYLGAVDFGRAVLNYKRALSLAPSNQQARTNLAYIQSVQNEPLDDASNLLSSAFFLNDSTTPETRLFIAAILFAAAVLLVVPWSEKHRKFFIYIATIPVILWLWMVLSVVAQKHDAEGVVLQECYLKTADNAGASNVSQTPLEPGFSVKILESRNDWYQVVHSNGQKGWIPRSGIESVELPSR